MPATTSLQRHVENAFPGFEPLTANYLYCPNQFFDVCLPNCSRGTVRIVAYLLRETLGWLDKQGNPRRQDISVSYSDLIRHAGVSRGAIGPALQQAVQLRFIECQQNAQAKAAGVSGQSAIYRLRWSTKGDYVTDPNAFDGFYAGEGYRTPVPNRFFDRVIPIESLSVIKVVGAIMRQTIGYQNQFGGRRQACPLSYRRLQQFTNLSDRSTLAQAIRHAQQVGYIVCVQAGEFAVDRSQQQTASYAVRWLSSAASRDNSSKIRPEVDQSKIPTRNGSETPPVHRFKNPTSKEKTTSNDSKQQVAANECVRLLTDAGLDEFTARKLWQQQGSEVVRQQLDWLDARQPSANRVGMLRKAIEENWPAPAAVQQRELQRQRREQHREQAKRDQQHAAQVNQLKQERTNRKQRLLREWGSADSDQRQYWLDEAIRQEPSESLKTILQRQGIETDAPAVQVLDVIAEERRLPPVTMHAERARDHDPLAVTEGDFVSGQPAGQLTGHRS